MNILIVKLAALGDVLRTTSLLRPLKERYPDARISWLTSPAALPLLENNPLVADVYTADKVLPRRLHGSFDLVLSMEEDLAAAGQAEIACRGRLVGVYPTGGRLRYTKESASYYRMSLLNRDPDGSLKTADRLKAANTTTYADLWMEILELPDPLDRRILMPVLRLPPGEHKTAIGWADRHGFSIASGAIGLNPGAGRRWPAKQVSVAQAAALADALHAAFGRPVVLFGGPDETARNRRILKVARAPIDDAGTGNDLRAFAARLAQCRVVVTTDSLAFHVATALARSVVGLVGPTSAAELDCFGLGELVKAERCDCFYKPKCLRKRSCLDGLPTSRIVEAVGRWLDRSGA